MSIERIRKGYLFREKWYINGVGPRVGASPYKHLGREATSSSNLASRGFFFEWLLAVMKSFAWLVCRVYATDKPSANDSANAKSHARDKPLLTG